MDKKPHEEQWTYDIGMEAVVDCDGAALTTRLDASDCRLIAAAPEMARALLGLKRGLRGTSFEDTIDDALRKAGVL